MLKIAEYEAHAHECRELAKHNPKPQQRHQLEEMANVWDMLAQTRARQITKASIPRVQRLAEDQVRTQKLLAELKVTPPPSREQQVRIYRDLIQLNPTNDDYTRKYWTIRNQLSQEREEQEHPLHFVAVRNLSWNSYDFHGVLEISGTIFNDLPWSIKDLTLSCTMTAPSGTILNLASGTLYEWVGAKSEKRITKFNMGFAHPQGRLSGCSVTNMTVNR